MPFAPEGGPPVDFDEGQGFNIMVSWDPVQEQYGMVLETGNDHAASLTQEQALEWASTMLAALAAAEHDRAVAIQQARLGASLEDISHVLHQLREARGPLEIDFLGIRLEPIIAIRPHHQLAAVVTVYRGDKPFGQMQRHQVLDHIEGLLMCGPSVKEDNTYYRWLTTTLEIEHGTATQVIADLINMHDPKLVFRPGSGRSSGAAEPPSDQA